MTQLQEPLVDPSLTPPRPLLDLPITRAAVERLVESILARPGADSDFLLITADAVQEVILQAPNGLDTQRLALLRDRLLLRASLQARSVPGKAEAVALLCVCPATAASLRMWRASMHHSCSAWGWMPLLDAMIAAAEEMEQQPRPVA